MRKIAVEVRDDHLEYLSRAKPMAALSELIWNALDADATEVFVEFVENELHGIESVIIRDNGTGLPHEDVFQAFGNLGGSWKREDARSHERNRQLHGKFGKGRFRAFGLGNYVEWNSTYKHNDKYYRFQILGRAESVGEFSLTDPIARTDVESGMTVAITNLNPRLAQLRGVKATEEVTDLFAPYLREYPDVKIVYDGMPLDPANVEAYRADYDLGEQIMENGERVSARLTVVEWNRPGRRGMVMCDARNFALASARVKPLFRGFSYTAYLSSPHFETMEKEGLLDVEEMAPDIKQLLEAARGQLRRHFSLREAKHGQEVLDRWREMGLYPYEGRAVTHDEECQRRIFDIYATHLNQFGSFSNTNQPAKRLVLRFLKELVQTEPTRAARVLDDLIAFPEDKEGEILDLIGED